MTELQLFYTSEEMEVINQSAYMQGWHDGFAYSKSMLDAIDNSPKIIKPTTQACGRNDKDCGGNGGSARCDGCSYG